MKKILFRKLLFDCLVFLLISLTSASIIIWVFQAVNFLDIIVEDGRDFLIYLSYTILNFPKIISKILPFATFFSFCYVLHKYEVDNQLMIFWNFGINKLMLVKFFFTFSFYLLLIQIILTCFIVPKTQNYSRSLIRNSSVDFFESFVKPKKFNDNIKNLTIYADEKDNEGNLKNIYLKKDSNNKDYQITYAKSGIFETVGKSKILVLFNGQTINIIGDKITSFNFSKSDFTLSQFDSDVIIQDKIQETSTNDLILCLNSYFDKYFFLIKDPPLEIGVNCTLKKLDNVFQELYKRIFIPFYIPVLIMISLLLITKSKEQKLYNKHKIIIFILGFLIIIGSESSLKLIENNFIDNIKFAIIPITTSVVLYFYFKSKFIFKVKS